MGTSGPYDAPSSWSDLKGNITRAARTEILTGPRAQSLIRSLIAHNGGRNEMAKGSRQGASGSAGSAAPARDVASRLGAFVADVRSLGFAKAVAKLGLGDLSGKPVSEVLLGLLDRLGGNSSTIDEADARQALSDLQEELFAEATDAEKLRPYCSMRPRTSKTFLNVSSGTTSLNNSVACSSNVWCSGWEISRRRAS